MKTKYHIEITRSVLDKHFETNALEKIIQSNIKQDRLKYQIGHDYIHFDGSAFEAGFNYISQNMAMLFESIDKGEFENAWIALGRILHSWQDFYSHSNYVDLWLEKVKDPGALIIDPDDSDILNSPKMQSGKNYGIFELLALIPGISFLIKPLMPANSHAKMNLDSPKSGKRFNYAYTAAKKRTEIVIEQILKQIEHHYGRANNVKAFLDK